MGKGLELFKEIAPNLSRFAVLANPTTPLHMAALQELEAAATKMQARLQPFNVRTPGEIEGAFVKMAGERVEALIILDDPMFALQSRQIADLAMRQRLPTISTERTYPEVGVLMSYGASFPDLFRRAASYVDKILRGAEAADLPVEQPTKFDLVINLKTARSLALTVPATMLVRADDVIE